MQPDWDIIESEVPGLVVRSVTLLGEGWSAKAYRVNEELVFKFPKRAAEWEELDREIAFLAFARPLLPVPVAEHLYQIRNSRGAPHGVAVYRRVPGAALAVGELSDPARAALATTLARFLRALHELSVGRELEPILRWEDERAVSGQYFRDAQEQIAPRLTGAAARRLSSLFIRHLEDPANFPAAPRIVHADLSAEHVLCADGAVTGILDWGDVSLGDPDYDFSYLFGDLGEAFVREVARQYGHPDPDRLVRKARYFRVVDQIGTIVYGSGRALVGDVAAAWRQLRALLHEAD
jgi:aminoglycoside phosphotransferase (APT) family kinase protein